MKDLTIHTTDGQLSLTHGSSRATAVTFVAPLTLKNPDVSPVLMPATLTPAQCRQVAKWLNECADEMER